MQTWLVLLIVCLLLIAVRGRVRERLEPTDKIKAPSQETGTYSAADKESIWASMPEPVRQAYGTTGWDPAVAKTVLATEVADFYKRVYEPATSPITEQQITAWADTVPRRAGDVSRADLSAALKAYFIDQAPPPPPVFVPESGDFTLSSSTPGPAEERRKYGAPVTVTIQVPPNASGVEMGIPAPTTEASPPPEAIETPAS